MRHKIRKEKGRIQRTSVDDTRGFSGDAAQALGGLDPAAAACVFAAGPSRAAAAGARATAQRTAATQAREQERERSAAGISVYNTTAGHRFQTLLCAPSLSAPPQHAALGNFTTVSGDGSSDD